MPETQPEKACKTCGLTFPLTNFWSAKNTKDGKRGSCKICVGAQISKLKEQKIIAMCNFGTSELCRKEYELSLYDFHRNIKRNDGKYRCLYCGVQDTHLNNFKVYDIDPHFFQNIDTEMKAYLLGIVAGDGHIASSGHYLEVVANNQDLETLELFRAHISPDNIIRKHSTSENCSKIIICSTVLCKDICRHLKIKAGKKSDKISLPDLEEYFLIPFIRGLLDSDGWVKAFKEDDRSRVCFYSSTSTQIIGEVKNFFAAKGIKSRIDGIKLVFNGNNASNALNILYGNATVFLSRKHNRFMEWSKV